MTQNPANLSRILDDRHDLHIISAFWTHEGINRDLPYGFTFTGRGYDMEVSIPFGRTDLAAPPDLEAVLVRCVESCPTAAIAFSIDREPEGPN